MVEPTVFFWNATESATEAGDLLDGVVDDRLSLREVTVLNVADTTRLEVGEESAVARTKVAGGDGLDTERDLTGEIHGGSEVEVCTAAGDAERRVSAVSVRGVTDGDRNVEASARDASGQAVRSGLGTVDENGRVGTPDRSGVFGTGEDAGAVDCFADEAGRRVTVISRAVVEFLDSNE